MIRMHHPSTPTLPSPPCPSTRRPLYTPPAPAPAPLAKTAAPPGSNFLSRTALAHIPHRKEPRTKDAISGSTISNCPLVLVPLPSIADHQPQAEDGAGAQSRHDQQRYQRRAVPAGNIHVEHRCNHSPIAHHRCAPGTEWQQAITAAGPLIIVAWLRSIHPLAVRRMADQRNSKQDPGRVTGDARYHFRLASESAWTGPLEDQG